LNETRYPTVILGGGFVGLFAALHLHHQRYSVPTLLIDREWSFTFKPLLYEFLSGEMNDRLIRLRYDDLLKHTGIAFVKDEIVQIDLQQQQIYLASGLHYRYEHLVLALGSVTNYLNVPGAQDNTIAFRTDGDAMTLGQHLRDRLQQASQTQDPDLRRQMLTVAILGAGRSGVELAGTLADLLPEWYAPLGGTVAEIRLKIVQRGQDILKGDPEQLRKVAEVALQHRAIPVELCLESEVKSVRAGEIELLRHDRVETLTAGTIIWTTGTTPHPLIKTLPIPNEHRDRAARLHVTPTLQLPDFPNVFAAGDCVTNPEHPLPTIAQVAYQQGAAIAHNLQALAENRSLVPAKVQLRGTLMKLGLAESVAEIFDRVEVKGNLGHLLRQATYIEMLPTPARNFKATAEWLSEGVFDRITGT
jgi:demethylphylloquinone reductase